MKLLLLSELGSIHTIRWAKSLAAKGIEIHIFGLSEYVGDDYRDFSNISLSTLGLRNVDKATLFQKMKYLKALPVLRRVYKEFRPDIVHAHYASSYGLLGRLLNKGPFIISVWGSDVFDFPYKNVLNKWTLTRNLNRADQVLSTSQIMAKQTNKFYNGEVIVTPFGVDIHEFKPAPSGKKDQKFIIGTVKTLAHIYGIDILIKAFKIFQDGKNIDAELHIFGDGVNKHELIELVKELNIRDKVYFHGKIPHSKVADVLSGFDIFAALSRQESFGVAVVEASACGIPSVVTDTGGLVEVVDNNITGLVVDSGSFKQAASAFLNLYNDTELRKRMGENARKKVLEEYNWENNVKQMQDIYINILQQNKK